MRLTSELRKDHFAAVGSKYEHTVLSVIIVTLGQTTKPGWSCHDISALIA